MLYIQIGALCDVKQCKHLKIAKIAKMIEQCTKKGWGQGSKKAKTYFIWQGQKKNLNTVYKFSEINITIYNI